MKTKTSTSLIIPSAIQPKPRKEDIITAMVERARVKHSAEVQECREKKEALTRKIEEAAKAEFKRNPTTPKIDIRSWQPPYGVELEFRVTTPVIQKMIEELKALREPRRWDAAEVKRSIRAGMAGERTNGVQALLENPAAVKALDASLAHIGI